MIGLELEGVLNQYQTFLLPLNRTRIRLQTWQSDESHLGDAHRYLQKALSVGRKDIAFDLRISLFINRFYALLAKILPIKARTFLSRLGKPGYRAA